MEEVSRYECVYHRNSEDFKDINKEANCWEKMEKKCNLPAAEAEVKFRNIRTGLWSLSEVIENPTFWNGARESRNSPEAFQRQPKITTIFSNTFKEYQNPFEIKEYHSNVPNASDYHPTFPKINKYCRRSP